VPTQLCPSHSHGSSGSHRNQECAPVYPVQCGPNMGSLISSPPHSLAASVQQAFQGEGTADCSQKYASRGSSSKDAVSIALILSKAFKGSVSKARQGMPARSNQFVREMQLLSYWCIRLW
jgi:hypothetical protein